MNKLSSKIVLAGIAVTAITYGCNKNEQDQHSIVDKQDSSTLVKLAAEVQNARSFNNFLALYHDSLASCTDPVLIAHCEDMINHYDSLYHHSESLSEEYHHQLDDIHHCNMIAECGSMMNDMMGNGGMMGGHDSHNNDQHQCSIMQDIEEYCSTNDDLELEHEQHCIQ